MTTYSILISPVTTLSSIALYSVPVHSIGLNSWRYDMPNSFYICSQSTAQELTDIFLLHLQNAINYRFLIIEISENRQGFLPKDTWNFIKNNS